MSINIIKICIVAFVVLFSASRLCGQNEIIIIGEIELINNGTIQIWEPKNNSYLKFKNKKIEVVNKEFRFEGSIAFPCQTAIVFFDSLGAVLESEWFFLDKGLQKIKIHEKNGKLIVESDSKAFLEYNSKLKLQFEEIEDSINLGNCMNDSIISAYLNLQKDKILFNYIFENPESFIGAGILNSFLNLNGYSNLYEVSYSLLNENLKRKKIGQLIKQKIDLSKSLNIGAYFPDFKFQDTIGDILNISQKFKSFTLIDFWFNSCPGCIKQFPDLKKIRDDYCSKGFEIINISVDKPEYMSKWREAIQKHSLDWPQFIDIGGKQSVKYLIKQFPTNFLIDVNGKILAKNISMDELNVFLLDSFMK